MKKLRLQTQKPPASALTVNRTLSASRTTLLILSLFGLTACAPIVLPRAPAPPQPPQAYPVQQQPGVANVLTQRPQPVVQNRQVVPQAGALVTTPIQVARAPTTNRAVQQAQPQTTQIAQAKPAQPQARQIAIPPILNPVQQARVTNNTNRSNNYRPSASVARAPAPTQQRQQPIWEDVTRKVAPAEKKTVAVRRPSASVRKPPASVSQKKKTMQVEVAKPTPQVSQQTQTAQVQQPEVLDLSGSLAKPAPTQEKKTPAVAVKPRSYSSSPAVAVLTKQANNQLTVGKAGRAAATLERALRIEPENPLLWLRLAEVNAQQGKKSQAASMARKAMGLAPGDAGLQARGKRLLN